MKIIRQSLIILIGCLMVYLTYQLRYGSTFSDTFYWLLLIVVWIVIFPITIYKEITAYKGTRKLQSFCFSFISVGFMLITSFVNISINSRFEKPSLLKAHYDGDINGMNIDFKTDGSFILDNSAIGCNSYTYGTYTISGNDIILTKTDGDIKVPLNNRLVIREVNYEGNNLQIGNYLFQTNDKGEVTDQYFFFRIIEDNRRAVK